MQPIYDLELDEEEKQHKDKSKQHKFMQPIYHQELDEEENRRRRNRKATQG